MFACLYTFAKNISMNTYYLVGYKEEVKPQDKAARRRSRSRSLSREVELAKVDKTKKREFNWKRTDTYFPEILVPSRRVSSDKRKLPVISTFTTKEERRPSTSSKRRKSSVAGNPLVSRRLSTSSKSKLR